MSCITCLFVNLIMLPKMRGWNWIYDIPTLERVAFGWIEKFNESNKRGKMVMLFDNWKLNFYLEQNSNCIVEFRNLDLENVDLKIASVL